MQQIVVALRFGGRPRIKQFECLRDVNPVAAAENLSFRPPMKAHDEGVDHLDLPGSTRRMGLVL